MSNLLQRNFFSSFLSVQSCLRYGSQYQSGNIWPKEIKSGGMIVWWMVYPYQLIIAIINSTERFPSTLLSEISLREKAAVVSPLNFTHWVCAEATGCYKDSRCPLVKMKSLWRSTFYSLWCIFTYSISFNQDGNLFGFVALIMAWNSLCLWFYIYISLLASHIPRL